MKQRQPERMVGMAEKASTAVEAANIVEQRGGGLPPIPVPLPPQKDKSLIIVSMLCK